MVVWNRFTPPCHVFRPLSGGGRKNEVHVPYPLRITHGTMHPTLDACPCVHHHGMALIAASTYSLLTKKSTCTRLGVLPFIVHVHCSLFIPLLNESTSHLSDYADVCIFHRLGSPGRLWPHSALAFTLRSLRSQASLAERYAAHPDCSERTRACGSFHSNISPRTKEKQRI